MWRSVFVVALLALVCLSGLEAKKTKGKKPGKPHPPQSCDTNEDCLGPSVCEGRSDRRAERRAARRENNERPAEAQDAVEETSDDTKFCKPPTCEANSHSAGAEAICNFHAEFGFNATCHPKRSRCLYPMNVRKFYAACRVVVDDTSALEREIDCPTSMECGQTEEAVTYNGVNYTISQCELAEGEAGRRGKGGRRGGRGRGKGRPGRGGRGQRGHRKGQDDGAANALDVEGDAEGPSRRGGRRRKGGRGNQENQEQ